MMAFGTVLISVAIIPQNTLKLKNLMKKIIFPILIISFFSCQKQTDQIISPVQQERKIEICSVDTTAILNRLVSARRPIKWQVTPTTPTTTTTTTTPTTTTTTTTTSTTLTPGTYSCIYLDFDGQIVTTAFWNNGNTIACASSGLSATSIAAVLAKVQSNYSAYNVVITDQESVYINANPAKRQRVIITPTSNWYPGVGGISYIGSLTFSDGTPSFVFSDKMYYDASYVGETVCHEAGHSVGLLHQSTWTSTCTLSNVYAPNVIMGNSLLGIPGVWTTGTTNVACNNYQNDRTLLSTKLGLK